MEGKEKIGFAKKSEINDSFSRLNSIDVSGHVEKIRQKDKLGRVTELSYLSWAWAWAEFKKVFPNATYEVKKQEDGKPYFTCDNGIMCYTSVTVGDLTYEMWLPVMNSANKAMRFEEYTPNVVVFEKETNKWVLSTGNPIAAATMFDVNKTIMRCLVKNLAMFGLGLYIYAGEDLPEETANDIQRQKMEVVEEGLKNIATRAELEDFFKSLEPKMKSDSKVAALFQKKAKEIE